MAEEKPIQAAPVNPPKDAPKDHQEDAETWRSRFEEAVQTRDEAKAKLKDVSDKYKQADQRLKEIEAKDAKEREAHERKQLEQEGKYAEALKLTEQKHIENYQKLSRTTSSKLVPLAIKSAAATIETLTPEAIQDLPQLLRDRVQLDLETMEPFVLGDDGKPLQDSGLKPVTVEQYVREFVSKRPYLHKSNMPAKHGIMAPAAGNAEFTIENCKDDTKKMREWAESDPTGYAKAVAEYYSPNAVLKRSKGK